MSKSVAAKPAKEEVQANEAVAPVAEKPEAARAAAAAPVAAKTAATAAAVKKVAARPKVVKKVVAAKPAQKPAADKPVPAPKAAPAKPVKKAVKTGKTKKQAPKKPKLIRDSFTIPEADYALFATLKQRALVAGVEVKKSEILRAAMLTLSNLDDAGLVKAIGLVERIKTGRPKK